MFLTFHATTHIFSICFKNTDTINFQAHFSAFNSQTTENKFFTNARYLGVMWNYYYSSSDLNRIKATFPCIVNLSSIQSPYIYLQLMQLLQTIIEVTTLDERKDNNICTFKLKKNDSLKLPNQLQPGQNQTQVNSNDLRLPFFFLCKFFMLID